MLSSSAAARQSGNGSGDLRLRRVAALDADFAVMDQPHAGRRSGDSDAICVQRSRQHRDQVGLRSDLHVSGARWNDLRGSRAACGHLALQRDDLHVRPERQPHRQHRRRRPHRHLRQLGPADPDRERHATTIFHYAPDGSRYVQRTSTGTSPYPKTVYYVDKLFEREIWNGRSKRGSTSGPPQSSTASTRPATSAT